MTDKQIIKQLAERYKEICRSPFADGYTFRAFDGECAEKGFTSDDIKNYIEKEKQERKAKRTESIKSLKEQLKRKEQECEELSKGYAELTEIVSPYMDDFTGYNEELGGFDIVLCVKELLQQLQAKEQECHNVQSKLIEANKQVIYLAKQLDQLKAENEELKKEIAFGNNGTLSDKIRAIVFKDLNKENNKLSKTLTEIKEIADDRSIYCENCSGGVEDFTCDDCGYVKIIQKCEGVNAR